VRSAAALVLAFALVATNAAPDRADAATTLFIRNHVGSNEIHGLTAWQGVLAAATAGGVVTVAMPDGPLGKILASPGGLPTNRTLAVASSPSGDLWIGTSGLGLARSTPAGGFRRTLTTFDGLPSDRVQAFLTAGDSVWVGTSGGVALFEETPSNARVTLRRSDSNASTAGGLVSDDVRAFAIVRDTLWVGTGAGLSSYTSGAWLDRRAVFTGPVNALLAVGDTLWVGTAAGPRAYAGGALAPVAPGHAGSTLALGEVSGVVYSATNGIGVFRRSGGSWVATGAGLTPGVSTLALGVAPDGALWAGGQIGLARYDAAGDAWVLHETDGPAVNNLQKTAVSGSTVWFTTGNATAPALGSGVVLRTDGTTWGAVTAASTGGALQATSVFGVFTSREGPIWFGHCCSPGPPLPRVDRYDPATDTWLAPGGSNVLSFGQSPSGRMFAASDLSGAFVYDGATAALLDSLTPATTAGSAFGQMSSPKLRGVGFESSGLAWFATELNGADRWNDNATDDHSDDRWDSFSTGFPDQHTTSVEVLPPNTVFIGTQAGIVVLTNGLVDLARKDAINAVIGAAIVQDLAADPRRVVWIATNSGLVRFDDATRSVERFTTADGLVDDDVRGVAWDEARGVLWAATANGVSEVHPHGAGAPAFTDGAYVYPNPARNGAPLRIGGLTGVVQGEIRDVTGNLVRHIHADPVNTVVWDLNDPSGAPAASGVYLVVLRDGDRVRVLKAAVTR
jgi:hypothetical protein